MQHLSPPHDAASAQASNSVGSSSGYGLLVQNLAHHEAIQKNGLMVFENGILEDADTDDAENTFHNVVETLKKREGHIAQQLGDFDKLWNLRRAPLSFDLEETRKEIERVQAQLAEMARGSGYGMPEPRGPRCLRWTESLPFAAVSNSILGLNLLVMMISSSKQSARYGSTIALLDNPFLLWYMTELFFKYVYHGRNLFFGRLHIVWWNWLDLSIVAAGAIEQWLFPILLSSVKDRVVNASVFRCVRWLRVFRLLRVVKALRALALCDVVSWAKAEEFDWFVSITVAVNSVVMSVELDVEWEGWISVDNIFLAIYFFELIVRIKCFGIEMFVDSLEHNLLSNYLDMAMVVGGVLELWVLPLQVVARSWLNDDKVHLNVHDDPSHDPILYVLKLSRLARILRFVRLVRVIKPLHRMLEGVMASLKAMQWVLLLALLMLYVGAIFWTSLVGKGLIYKEGEAPPEAAEHFGSVAVSFFSLFRLMNGDTDVVTAVASTVLGQLIFAAFMVISNWAILAILTSVVSDNMISASHKAYLDDMELERAATDRLQANRLRMLFQEFDTGNSGVITEDEWEELFADPGLCSEIQEVTSLPVHDIREIFQNLSITGSKRSSREPTLPRLTRCSTGFHGEDRGGNEECHVLEYNSFIVLMRNMSAPADRRCVLQILAKMQSMERYVDERLNRLHEAPDVDSRTSAFRPLGSILSCESGTSQNEIYRAPNQPRSRQRPGALVDLLDSN